MPFPPSSPSFTVRLPALSVDVLKAALDHFLASGPIHAEASVVEEAEALRRMLDDLLPGDALNDFCL